MSTFNLFGGTPKKTLDLIKYGHNNCSLYVWSKNSVENKSLFIEAGASVYEGYYGRNLIKHVNKLIKIIDEGNIDIIQTQFSFGEVLAGIAKIFRPKIRIVNAFVGPFNPKGVKGSIVNLLYKRVDHLVFISEYVKREKERAFPSLKSIDSSIIFNGTEIRKDTKEVCEDLRQFSLFDIAGLVDWKNINVLIEAVYILGTDYAQTEVFLYIAGDGPERINLELNIEKLGLSNRVFLLGYQKNIGRLLKSCNVFVHPAYAEGFGIAVAEAMIEGKPTIVANAGALPELLEDGVSGLIVDAGNAKAWAAAINSLIVNDKLSRYLGVNAKNRAVELFSVNRYVANYESLYKTLMDDNNK
jgi:glycosyltransferase involved in cell wall biosynthesis